MLMNLDSYQDVSVIPRDNIVEDIINKNDATIM